VPGGLGMRRLNRILVCSLLLIGSASAADRPQRAIVQRLEPEYPEIAKTMNLHGTVKLRIWIKPDGTVRRLEYIGGHPLLAESALKAVKSWKYAAAQKETTAVLELKF
jgi:TonB family protein